MFGHRFHGSSWDRRTKGISPTQCSATYLRRAAKVAQAVSIKVALYLISHLAA
jgi:hypothetical protein